MNKWLCNTNANAKIANTDPGHSKSKQGQREYLKGELSAERKRLHLLFQLQRGHSAAMRCSVPYSFWAIIACLHSINIIVLLGTQSHAMTGVH